jgi:GGDEF domain-containing protein
MARDGAKVYRTTGDEFAFFPLSYPDVHACTRDLQKTVDLLSQPHEIGGVKIYLTASIGATEFPYRDDTPDRVIQCALRRQERSQHGTCLLSTDGAEFANDDRACSAIASQPAFR